MATKDSYRQLCKTEDSLPIFSRDWWLDAVCGEKNWDALTIVEKDVQVVAALPFYAPTSRVISMPPYTQSMGPWFAADPEGTKYSTMLRRRQMFCKTFIDQLSKYSVFLQNFNYNVTDWLPFYWEGYQQTTRYTYLLKDIKRQNALLENMDHNVRNHINRAKEKYRITVKHGIPTEEFLRICRLTFERQQAKPKHLNVLKRLINVCRKRQQGDLWGGYDTDGRLHAAAFIVWQNSSAYYIAGGHDPALRNTGTHSLVLWEAIRAAAAHTNLFDFEGSMLPGVERFFREFGGIQTPYFSISKGKTNLFDRALIKLSRSFG